MTDSNGDKVEITKNAPIVPFDEDSQIVTYIGAGENEKNGIVFDVPTNDDEAQERYNCSMAYLARAGVRNLSHHVTYDGSHEDMQAAADAYKVGSKGTGAGRKTIKKVEAERDALLAVAIEASGMTADAIRELVSEYQATA